MSVSRAITVRQPASGVALINDLQDAANMAKYVAESGLFACKNPAEALVKIVAGAELGFAPIAAMSDIHIIEGKPSVGAHLMAAAIRRSGRYDYKILEHTDKICTIAFYRRLPTGEMEQSGVVTHTLQEAHDNGWHLAQGGKEKLTWKTKSRNMLFARVISDGYKWYTPDLTGGMLVYDRDEIETDMAPNPRMQVLSPSSSPTVNQLEHVAQDTEFAALTLNEDGGLRSELDDIMETRNRCEDLIRELGFTPQQMTKKLTHSYSAEHILQLDLAALRKLEAELLAVKSKRIGSGTTRG